MRRHRDRLGMQRRRLPQREWREHGLSHRTDSDGGTDVLYLRRRFQRVAGELHLDGHAAGGPDDDHLAALDHHHHHGSTNDDQHHVNDDDHAADDDHHDDHHHDDPAAADHHDQHDDLHHDDHDADRAAGPDEPDGDADELQRGGSPLDALERVRLGLQRVPQSERGHDVHDDQATRRDACLPGGRHDPQPVDGVHVRCDRVELRGHLHDADRPHQHAGLP